MPKHPVRISAKCPFYKGEQGIYIFCEGIAPDVSLRLAFGNGAKAYREACCCKDWRSCIVAQMLERKYE